jgi:hypothetical protein
MAESTFGAGSKDSGGTVKIHSTSKNALISKTLYYYFFLSNN